ncbi:MAG TPA: hypothetical protein PKA27_06125 [Fimbriimonadaceae bacterium]|nr:hypothetical protein [Fimbriimonadaceae bacterium]
MIRARSPLFLAQMLALFVAFGALGVWVQVARADQASPLVWKSDKAFVAVAESASKTTLVVAAGLWLLLITMEVLIWMGWEPRFLRRRIYGAVLESSEPAPERQGHQWQQYRHPNGEIEVFLADPTELLPAGSVVRLDVIGKYVADVVLLEPTVPSRSRLRALLTAGEGGMFGWIFMTLVPPGTGYVLGNLLLVYITGEAVRSVGRYARRTVHLSGGEAYFYASLLSAAALAAFIFCLYRWKVGWDRDTFDRDRV